MHDNIRKNTSGRAVASTRQIEALASVIFFFSFLLFLFEESKMLLSIEEDSPAGDI